MGKNSQNICVTNFYHFSQSFRPFFWNLHHLSWCALMDIDLFCIFFSTGDKIYKRTPKKVITHVHRRYTSSNQGGKAGKVTNRSLAQLNYQWIHKRNPFHPGPPSPTNRTKQNPTKTKELADQAFKTFTNMFSSLNSK